MARGIKKIKPSTLANAMREQGEKMLLRGERMMLRGRALVQEADKIGGFERRRDRQTGRGDE